MQQGFIQVPCAAKPTSSMFQATRVLGPEFYRLLSDRFIRHVQATLNEHSFDFAKAQTGSIIEPDRVADDFS